jgi:DNA-binding MurR/RpiR family transcriptional regulator
METTLASLVQRVEALRAQLSPSALRVADYLVEHPQDAAEASAADIAAQVNTSDATVVRTVKQLGYSGLPQLRRATKSEWALSYNPRAVLQERLATINTETGSVLDLLVKDATDVLRETSTLNPPATVSRATTIVAEARTVLVVGFGRAGTLADHLALGLNRIGHHAQAATNAGFRLADDLAALSDTDTVVLLAPLRFLTEIRVAINHATAIGATTVLITETLGERLANDVTVVLNTAGSRHRLVSETVATIAVLDALLLGVATTSADRALNHWATLNQLRADLAGTQMDLPLPLPNDTTPNTQK